MRTESKIKDEEGKLELGELLNPDRSLLPTFKVGRDSALQMAAIERDLFTEMEEENSGKYIISGLEKSVTELDFTALTFGLGQILSNQSYLCGNEDVNSGVVRQTANTISRETGIQSYSPYIVTSLNDLCRLAYGEEPTTEIKKKTATILGTMDKRKVKVKFPNGVTCESRLLAVMNEYTRDEDGAKSYEIALNPIFSSRIKDQFGELPQGVISDMVTACKSRGQRKQAAHYLLLRWLSVQDKRYPHTLNIGTIVQELRMEEYFKKDKSKAEKQILSCCDTMVEIGLLSNYLPTLKGKRIDKITFHLNPDYIRESKKGISKKEKED